MFDARGQVEEPNSSGERAAGSVATLERPSEIVAEPPAKRRRLPFFAAIAVAVLIVLALLVVLANNALSQTYSPSRAALDYFNAQSRGDVNGMWANATYERAEGSYSELFDKTALSAMMSVRENRDLRNIKVTSVTAIDSSTSSVTVSFTWHGVARSLVLQARKDPGDVHWLFYPSWRVTIPATTLYLTLPNQAGSILIDGISNPPGASATTIRAIMGFHEVRMGATDLYNPIAQTVDAVQPANVTLKGTLSQSALDQANTAVKNTLTTSCDVAKYDDCPGHTYSAPDQNYIYYFTVPGHGNVDYTNYLFTLTGDPTSGMTLTVSADPGKVSVSGSCTTTLTVNGRNQYKLKGTFSGTLTWNSGAFDSDLLVNCDTAAG